MKQISLKILRGFLIVVIVFFMARGVFSIFNQQTESSVRDALAQAQTTLIASTEDTEAVRNLAELIAMETLTYAKEDASYKDRINAFGFAVEADVSNLKGASIAKSAKAIKVKELGNHQYDVSVQVLVEYPEQKETQMLTLTVPVYKDSTMLHQDGNVLIQATRTLEKVSAEPIKARTLSDDTLAKEIVLQTENFLKNYYEGTQSELAVYLVDSEKTELKAMEGRVKLVPKKTEVSVYALKSGQYLSVVNTKVSDINGVELAQRFHIIVERSGDKYLIRSMETRVQNINSLYDFKEE